MTNLCSFIHFFPNCESISNAKMISVNFVQTKLEAKLIFPHRALRCSYCESMSRRQRRNRRCASGSWLELVCRGTGVFLLLSISVIFIHICAGASFIKHRSAAQSAAVTLRKRLAACANRTPVICLLTRDSCERTNQSLTRNPTQLLTISSLSCPLETVLSMSLSLNHYTFRAGY